MDKCLIFCAGKTEAARYARSYLLSMGVPVTGVPSRKVSSVLLDVPSFEAGGNLRLGGTIEELLATLPSDVTVYGGNLNHPALREIRTVDFLQDASYLAQNAHLTAQCALDVALPYLTVTLRRCPVLILGWGRIGKCLAQLLKALEADVTVSARKESDRAVLQALGYHAEDTARVGDSLTRFRLIFNTVPAPVLDAEQMARCREDCIKIELASRDGMAGDDIVIARGLPGVHLPESSGHLIAETFLRLWEGDHV